MKIKWPWKRSSEKSESQADESGGEKDSSVDSQIPFPGEPAAGGELLRVGDNCRELGGYPLPSGGLTLTHRFLRSGQTAGISAQGIAFLDEYGLKRVVDLRSAAEVASSPDIYANRASISYVNIPLYGQNMHDERLGRVAKKSDYFASGYLRMLGNHDAIRRIFSAFAEAADDECVLFHCAAGMDRTGVTAMLLLGSVGVARPYIVADYTYSFSTREEVDNYLWHGKKARWSSVSTLSRVIGEVYDDVVESYGSVNAYLKHCGVTTYQLAKVRHHLTGE